MDRQKVAEILEEIGVLLELKGENPFKTRAYYNVARELEGMNEDLETLVRENRLSEIKGVGAALEQKISELVKTGRLAYHEDLKASIPAGLLDLKRIPSLGPKKIKALHDSLQVVDLDTLEKACRQGAVAGLPGFGEKTQDKILKGIELVRKSLGLFLWPDAHAAARSLIDYLVAKAPLIRIETAGSLRRSKEIIKDVDLVSSSTEPEKVMDALVAYPEMDSLTGRGPTKCSIRLKSGLAVDLRVVEDDQYATALLYFTGSKEHNTAMRGRARKLGYKLNEYGLFQGEAPLPVKDEADVFRHLGLEYIPPELREDLGEIEEAEKGPLPALIRAEELQGIFHNHSTWSDGTASIRDMALAAREMGFHYMGLSDHSRTAAYARGLKTEDVLRQWEEIDQLNQELDGIRILKGIESDILPDGSLDYPDEILAGFDFVIGSVHANFNLTREEQTQRIIRAMQSPYLTMVGHLTGRLLLQREGFGLDIDRIIEAAHEHHVILEFNASPQRLDVDWRHLSQAQQKGLMFSINPDAHSVAAIGHARQSVPVARKGRLRTASVLNTRPLPEVLDFLKEQRRLKGAAARPA